MTEGGEKTRVGWKESIRRDVKRTKKEHWRRLAGMKTNDRETSTAQTRRRLSSI